MTPGADTSTRRQTAAAADRSTRKPWVTPAILERMSDDRPQADCILVAQLTGEARFRARWRTLTEAEEREAAAALRELAGGRTDLLAEVAGILEGASEGEMDEPLARQAAMLCWVAGADPEAVPAWVAEGRRRRDAARLPPHSGGVRGHSLSGVFRFST